MAQKQSDVANMDYEQIKWPSDRIAQGGLFHVPQKMEYSQETRDLIKCKFFVTKKCE